MKLAGEKAGSRCEATDRIGEPVLDAADIVEGKDMGRAGGNDEIAFVPGRGGRLDNAGIDKGSDQTGDSGLSRSLFPAKGKNRKGCGLSPEGGHQPTGDENEVVIVDIHEGSKLLDHVSGFGVGKRSHDLGAQELDRGKGDDGPSVSRDLHRPPGCVSEIDPEGVIAEAGAELWSVTEAFIDRLDVENAERVAELLGCRRSSGLLIEASGKPPLEGGAFERPVFDVSADGNGGIGSLFRRVPELEAVGYSKKRIALAQLF